MEHMGIVERETVTSFPMDSAFAYCTMVPRSIRLALAECGIKSPTTTTTDVYGMVKDDENTLRACRAEWGEDLEAEECIELLKERMRQVNDAKIEVQKIPGISIDEFKILKFPDSNDARYAKIVDFLMGSAVCQAVQWNMNIATNTSQSDAEKPMDESLLKKKQPNKFAYVHSVTFTFDQSNEDFWFGTDPADYGEATFGFKKILASSLGGELTDYADNGESMPWRVYFLATKDIGGYQRPHLDFTLKDIDTKSSSRRFSSCGLYWSMDMPVTPEGSSINIWAPPYEKNVYKLPIKVAIQHGEICLRSWSLIHGGNMLGCNGGAALRLHAALALKSELYSELEAKPRTERKDARGEEISNFCICPNEEAYKNREAVLIQRRQERLKSANLSTGGADQSVDDGSQTAMETTGDALEGHTSDLSLALSDGNDQLIQPRGNELRKIPGAPVDGSYARLKKRDLQDLQEQEEQEQREMSRRRPPQVEDP